MNRTTLFIIAAVVIALIVGVLLYTQHKNTPPKEGVYAGPALPAQRPPNLHISYSYSVGMVGYNSSVYLSEKESYSETSDRGSTLKTPFTITPAELDQLYTVFRDNHFEKVTWQTQEVYDGGGGMLNLSWEGNSISKDIGDRVVMDSTSQKIMDTVNQALQQFVAAKLATLSSTLTVKAGQGIADPNQLRISFDNGPLMITFDNAKTDTITLLPGEHHMTATLSLPDGTMPTIDEKIMITKNNTSLVFSFSNKKLQYVLR